MGIFGFKKREKVVPTFHSTLEIVKKQDEKVDDITAISYMYIFFYSVDEIIKSIEDFKKMLVKEDIRERLYFEVLCFYLFRIDLIFSTKYKEERELFIGTITKILISIFSVAFTNKKIEKIINNRLELYGNSFKRDKTINDTSFYFVQLMKKIINTNPKLFNDGNEPILILEDGITVDLALNIMFTKLNSTGMNTINVITKKYLSGYS